MTDNGESVVDATPPKAVDLSKNNNETTEDLQKTESDIAPEFINIKTEVQYDESSKEESDSDTEDLMPLSALRKPKVKDIEQKTMYFETFIKLEHLEENDERDNKSESEQEGISQPELLTVKLEPGEVNSEDEEVEECADEQTDVSEQDLNRNAIEDGRYMCPICQRRFATKGVVLRHQLLHTKQNLQCPVCSKKFIQEWHLKKHILSHSQKTFDCNDCGKKFNSTSNLGQHKRTHLEVKPYKCDICLREFSVRSNYMKHLGKKRCKLATIDPIVCDICQKVFKSQYLLQSHLRRHTTERPYKCETCNMSYKYKSTVIRHIQLHKGEKPYSCKICSKTFTHAGLLKPHMRKHTGEKPFTCPTCSKKFAHKHNMERHTQRHAKIKQLVCEICYRKFPKESRLKYHMRTHIKDKPFPCKLCSKQFTHKQNAKRHYHRKHPGHVYDNPETDASHARVIWEQVVAKSVKLEPMKTANGCSKDEYVLP